MNFGSYDDIESLMQQRPVYYAKIRRRSILIEAREVFGPLQSESQLEKGLKQNIATAPGGRGASGWPDLLEYQFWRCVQGLLTLS